VHVWDITSGVCLRALDCQANSVALTADGNLALSANSDNSVSVWDVATGDCIRTLGGYESNVVDVSVTADGRIALAADKTTFRFWDVPSGALLREVRIPSGEIERAALTPDGRIAITIEGGRRLSSGNRSWTIPNRLHVWDVQSGECVRTLASGVKDATLTSDARIAVSAGLDGLDVWDVVACDIELTLEERNKDEVSATDAIFSPDDKFMLIPSYNDLRVSPVESGEIRYLQGHTDAISSAALSPDGRMAISGGFDCAVRVWDIPSGACLRLESGGYGNRVAFGADGRIALSGSAEIDVWDLASGERLRSLPAPADAGNLLAIGLAPDNKILVSSNSDSLVRVWNISAGALQYFGSSSTDKQECMMTLAGHTELVLGITLTPDGRKAISASADGALCVWDLVSGTCLHALAGHSGLVRRVSVTSDGKTALSASEDRTVRIWDLASGLCKGLYYADRRVISLSRVKPDGRFACVTTGNEMHHLALRCVEQSPPIITAVRLFQFELADRELPEDGDTSSPLFAAGQLMPGHYEDDITARCAWCGERFATPVIVADTISQIIKNANLTEYDSPCLKLPEEAWREPRLLSECPRCCEPLMFNPFTVDNRDRYGAV
jgi:WD40 repeat protein